MKEVTMNLQMAIQSFSNSLAFLCTHCGAECETPSCRTVIEAKEAIAFLDGVKTSLSKGRAAIMRNNTVLIRHTIRAMLERLDDPKNSCKGDFPVDIAEIVDLYREEVMELEAEFMAKNLDWERVRYEAADLAVCLSFLISECDRRIK
jgi:NTP pyrophosphatase (non-canonical NTP hydrolase)